MKSGNFHRMGKKKESGDAVSSPGRKKPMPSRKRGGANGGNDDDSIDSRGNVRDLIAYSVEDDSTYHSDSESSADTDLTPEQRATIRKHARKAAEKARRRIQKTIEKEAETSPHGTRINKKKKRAPVNEIIDESSDSDDTESEDEGLVRRKRGFFPRRGRRQEEVEDESDEDNDESEEDADDEESEESEEEESADDDEYDEEESKSSKRKGISISFGFGAEEDDERMIPKRHNMKKEGALVKKFVKLVTEPQDDGGIDDQIDQFKALSEDKQKQLIETLERKPASPQENLMFKILTMSAQPDTKALILAKYNAIQGMDPSSGEYFKHRAWLEKATALPLGTYKEMPVKLDDGSEICGVFMDRARKCLADAIYGQEESKLQILQFIASKIANPTARGLSLLLIGPPGIGKTSLIKNGIAKALEWPFQFISLGGDSDATTYTGHQLVYEGSHAGKIVNSVIGAKSMSMVLMFDELDKISSTPKGEEVQNLLVHLTDATQNSDFEDKYLSGIPLDLSRSMFVFSGNDINKIDRVLLDRMTVIQLQGYDKKEKLAIAENFLLPTALKEVNLIEKVGISKEVLEHIVTEYAGLEPGVRELKRCIEQITQKINMLRIFNTKELPFHIPDFSLPFVVKKSHVDLFLKKKDVSGEKVPQGMYT